MKILYTSDTHIGITKPKTIRKMLERASKEEFDVFLHLGDYCGGTVGYKSVRSTVKFVREILGDIPYVSVLGNHDYWRTGTKYRSMYGYSFKYPRMSTFQSNLKTIESVFEEFNVHFLDKDGPYVHPDFSNIKLLGHSGWYAHPHPPTNDEGYLPYGIEGNTNAWMYKNAMNGLFKNMEKLDKNYSTSDKIVFCSHFPVIRTGDDYKGNWDLFSWSEQVGNVIRESYLCKHFINGHSHSFHKGPLRYESGSHYSKPKYDILEIL